MFEFVGDFFNYFLYFPLFNGLVFFYNYLGKDFGVAIIALTVVIRLILYPLTVKALKSQKALQGLQAQLQEIQRQHKTDKEKQAKETLELYKREKINPFSGLFLALIQLPVLIVLYKVFWNGLNPGELQYLYSFIANPGQINAVSLGLINLSEPNWVFAIVAGILQFFQTKMLLPEKPKTKTAGGGPADISVIMQKQMTYLFPIVTVIILFRLPSALGLYWIISSALSIAQQYFILKKSNNDGK